MKVVVVVTAQVAVDHRGCRIVAHAAGPDDVGQPLASHCYYCAIGNDSLQDCAIIAMR